MCEWEENQNLICQFIMNMYELTRKPRSNWVEPSWYLSICLKSRRPELADVQFSMINHYKLYFQCRKRGKASIWDFAIFISPPKNKINRVKTEYTAVWKFFPHLPVYVYPTKHITVKHLKLLVMYSDLGWVVLKPNAKTLNLRPVKSS